MRPAGKPAGNTRKTRDAAADYRRKAEHEISGISRRLKRDGHPAPLGDPASGVVFVVEQPAGPRILDALRASLRAVGLPDAYVTHAETGLLGEEILATQPHALVAVGPGAARDVDDLDYPLARNTFAAAAEGTPFAWTSATDGLTLPSLSLALRDDQEKRRFWRCFLPLKALAP